MNKKQVKARTKADNAQGIYINGYLEGIQMNARPDDEWPLTPVFVLPATPDAVAQMREQAIADLSYPIALKNKKDAVNAVFRSLGLTPKEK